MSSEAIDDEASGYFLVPTSQLDNSYSNVSTKEAGQVFGKGYVTAIDPKATKHCDRSSNSCGVKPGMAAYRFHLLAASLSVTDVPLVVPTGYGPGLDVDVTYNQREYGQASTQLNTHFSPQWVSGLVSHLEDNTTNDAASVTVYLPGGGSEVHSGYTVAPAGQGYLGYYGLERESHSRLYRITPGQYERRSMDGSKLIYQRAIGTGTARSVFLSQVMDAQGNALTYSYDSLKLARINSITSATNQIIYFFYADPTTPYDPYLVTAIADDPDLTHTSRKVSFTYQVASTVKRLASITDPLGIVSSFGYDGTGFMNSLTTPYGITTFTTGGGEDDNLLRWLEAKNAQGDTERVEFRNDVDETTISASPLPSGTDVSTMAYYRRYRNTFYWDRKAWVTAPGDRSKAHLYHWLHAPDGTGAFGVLEMEKSAFENNIWYNYKDQINSSQSGPSASPSAISRAVEGPDGTVQSSIQRLEYHPLTGNLTMSTDAVGRVTRFTYDATGYDLQAVEMKNGANWDLIASYSNYVGHQPRTITDAQGQPTTLTYTASGQIETITNALNEVTTATYETNPAADGYGKVKTITGAVPGSTTTVTYDTLDRIRTVTDSASHTTTYDYDVFDRVTLITYPDTTTEQYVYDKLDLYAQKDRQGRWTRTWYNALRQPVLTADALGQSIQYQWCKCGAMSKLTDSRGQVTSWKHDAQARMIEKIYPDGRKEVPAYEPLSGRLLSSKDAKSQIKTFTYNLDDSVKSYSYSDVTTPGVSFTYDPLYPRVSTVTDGTGLTSCTYKQVGQLGALMPWTVDGPLSGQTDLITYTYDALGRGKTRNIGPLGTENLVTLNYDNLGRMTSTVNNLGSFGYFYVGATRRLDYVNLPNGQKTAFDYFPASGDNRLKTINHLASGTTPTSTISRFDYTYSPGGSISTWQRQFGSDPATASQFVLGYDLANQLTSASLAPVANPTSITQRYSYQYDNAGNRTSEQIGNQVTSASHNNANKITGTAGGGKLLVAGNTDEPAKVKVNGIPATVTPPPQNLYQAWIDVAPGPTNSITVEATDYSATPNTTIKSWNVAVTGGTARNFGYDTNGNTLSDGLRTYQWDAEDRLLKITQGANIYEFTYDGLSRRVTEKVNGTLTRRWLWDGAQIAEERDAGGTTVKKRYFNQGEQRIGGADAGSYYYTRDHLGSIREMTDSTTTVRARYDYDPYGRRSKLSGDLDCDFGFTGHYDHAESGLNLTLYRAYDADLGRWLSPDPIRENGGLNLYGYVGGDPINGIDLLGLQCYALPKEYAESSEFREGFNKGMRQGGILGTAITVAVFAPEAYAALLRNPRAFILAIGLIDETAVVSSTSAALLASGGWQGAKLVSGQSGNLSREIVEHYKDLMRAGEAIPRIGTCTMNGIKQIGEGNHRVRAAIELGAEGDWSHLKRLLDLARDQVVTRFPFDVHVLPK